MTVEINGNQSILRKYVTCKSVTATVCVALFRLVTYY